MENPPRFLFKHSTPKQKKNKKKTPIHSDFSGKDRSFPAKQTEPDPKTQKKHLLVPCDPEGNRRLSRRT